MLGIWLFYVVFLMFCAALLRSPDGQHLAFSVRGVEEVHPSTIGLSILHLNAYVSCGTGLGSWEYLSFAMEGSEIDLDLLQYQTSGWVVCAGF